MHLLPFLKAHRAAREFFNTSLLPPVAFRARYRARYLSGPGKIGSRQTRDAQHPLAGLTLLAEPRMNMPQGVESTKVFEPQPMKCYGSLVKIHGATDDRETLPRSLGALADVHGRVEDA